MTEQFTEYVYSQGRIIPTTVTHITTNCETLVTTKGAYGYMGETIRTALWNAYHSDPRHNGTLDSEPAKEYKKVAEKVNELVKQSQIHPVDYEKWRELINRALNPWTQKDASNRFTEMVACVRTLNEEN